MLIGPQFRGHHYPVHTWWPERVYDPARDDEQLRGDVHGARFFCEFDPSDASVRTGARAILFGQVVY